MTMPYSDYRWYHRSVTFFKQRIENRPKLKKIIANMGWLFFEKMFVMGIGLVVGIWVARYLGPEQFGTLNYAMAFVALFTPLAKLGLDSIVIREIIRYPEDTDIIISTAFTLKLIGGCFVMLCAVTAQYFFQRNDFLSLILVAILSLGILFQSAEVFDFWFQAHILSKYTVWSHCISTLLIALFRVGLILTGASVIFFGIAACANHFVIGCALIISFFTYKRKLIAWRFDREKAKFLLKSALPLIFQGVFIIIYMRIDQVMLKSLANSHEVGIYAAAVRLTEIWYFIPMIITSSLFPSIIDSKKLRREIYFERIQNLYNLMIWMSILMAVFVSIFSSHIVFLLYGEKYSRSAIVLSMQIWLGCSVFFGVARQKWLIAENYLKDGLYVQLIGVSLNVVCNILLIPKYGAIGASTSALVSNFSSHVIVSLFSRPIRLSLYMYIKSILFPITFLMSKSKCAT